MDIPTARAFVRSELCPAVDHLRQGSKSVRKGIPGMANLLDKAFHALPLPAFRRRIFAESGAELEFSSLAQHRKPTPALDETSGNVCTHSIDQRK